MPRPKRRTNDETSVADDGATLSADANSVQSPESTNVSHSTPQNNDNENQLTNAPSDGEAVQTPVSRTPRPRAKRVATIDAASIGNEIVPSALPLDASVTAADLNGSIRRRRPGGRRSSSEQGSVELSKTSADSPAELESTMDGSSNAASESGDASETSTRSRRSRRGGQRRRGGKSSESAESDVSSVDGDSLIELPISGLSEVNSPDGENTDAELSEDGENAAPTRGKSRRSGRGGRRPKSDRTDSSEDGTVVDAAQTELTLPLPHVREHWSAPSLIPSISDLDLGQFDLGINAHVIASGNFAINDEIVAPYIFFVNAEGAGENHDLVVNQIRRAAKAGIHLHTCVVYLPLKNAHGERNFAPVDRSINTILSADPEAKIVLRVQCVPTNFWVRVHPNQMCKYRDGSEGDVSMASVDFWEDCVLAVDALLRRLSLTDTPGYARIFAVHLDKGEWFHEPGAGYDYSLPSKMAFRNWLRERYQTLYALRAAWFDGKVNFDTADVPEPEASLSNPEECVLFDRPKDRRHVDYLTFASEQVGNILIGLASAIKALTSGNLLVFAPYGYLFEFANRNGSGHQSLGKVLNTPNIDVLTGPNSYLGRAAGSVGGFATPVDSLKLHGKLWIVEDDTKTYLAPDDTPDTYNPHVAGQQETVMVHRRNLFTAAAHGCGIAWMDLWGQGWLESDSIWEELATGLEHTRLLSPPPDFNEEPEVAVLIDEQSYSWVRSSQGGQRLQMSLIAKARDLMARTGAQVRYYLQSDVALLPASIKVVFFLNALRVSTEERIAIREKLQRDGRTLVWVYAPGMFDENGKTPAEVSELVGMPLKSRSWNSKVGTVFTDERHAVIDRLHGGKRMGTEDVLNPSFTAIDPQSSVLGEYAVTGETSVAIKNVDSDWKSIFVGEPHLTGELIRGILRFAGVHLFDVQDDIVSSRGDGMLMIHAPYTGQRVIHLPTPVACYCVTESRLLAKSQSSIRHFMRGRSTQLFLWGPIDLLAQRLGKTVFELEATIQQRNNDSNRGRGQRDDSQFDSGDTGSEYRSEQDIDTNEYNEPAAIEDTNEDPASRAKREAAIVTQAVLSEDISTADPIDVDTDGFENAGNDDDGGSSHRRIRRRGPTPTPANDSAELPATSPGSIVDKILGGLLGRRHKPRR